MSSPTNRVTSTAKSDELSQVLRATSKPNLALLQWVWQSRDLRAYVEDAEIYKSMGERVLQLGEPLLAYDVLSEGTKLFPSDASLRRLIALALARSGASESANTILAELFREGHRDEESLGLLARTHKDLAAQANSNAQRERHLRQAYLLYDEAYQRTGGYWSGINAATLACLLNKRKRAAILATQVQSRCRQELCKLSGRAAERYWIYSTLGEAALVQRNWGEAELWYTQAVKACEGDWGSLQSTLHNARLLLSHFGDDLARLEQLFRFPTVIVFAGHLVDLPTRRVPRFPPELAEAVKKEISRRVQEFNGGFGYASAACGGDILFHEAVLEAGGEVRVVLPYERELFSRKSVDVGGSGNWVKRFKGVLAKAVDVHELSEHDQEDDRTSLEFANLMLHGLAQLRAEQLETKLIPLVLWDGKPGDGPGGTADNVARWRKVGMEVEIVDLGAMLYSSGYIVKPESRRGVPPAGRRQRRRHNFVPEIRPLLFADFEGFSKLSDAEVPRFVNHCLGLVGKLVRQTRNKPIMKNTWGDGLFLVFNSVRDAGNFALEFRERVCRTAWAEKGLPNMKVRIGLHAGPVFSGNDPVTQRMTYIGAHVSRAARIEPITPPGHVYASQAFAALASAEGVREFRCDYVGQTSLAKKYGTYPTYVVLGRFRALHGR
jgi:class 3 adenylate cyclase